MSVFCASGFIVKNEVFRLLDRGETLEANIFGYFDANINSLAPKYYGLYLFFSRD
jgi:hypothetical protein